MKDLEQSDKDYLIPLLESRHETMLQWDETRAACGPEGNTMDAHITLRASIHDCINLQRTTSKPSEVQSNDVEHLLDFINTNHAQVIPALFTPTKLRELRKNASRLVEYQTTDFRVCDAVWALEKAADMIDEFIKENENPRNVDEH